MHKYDFESFKKQLKKQSSLRDDKVLNMKDFFIIDPKLIYYRKPRMIEIQGCVDPYTGQQSGADIECEFKDDIVEMIIDEAVSIMAGDISDVNTYQRGDNMSEKNN